MADEKSIILRKNEDNSFEMICNKLLISIDKVDHTLTYASAKRVLLFIGTGASIAASLLSPRFGTIMAKEILREMNGKNCDWKSFNTSYLKQTLRRLEKQKAIEIKTINGKEVFCITNQGKTKALHFALDQLKITKPKQWDKKWRVLLYDIVVAKKHEQEALRRIVKKLGFYQVQKSVYIFPYPCFDEVEYLRSYFGVTAEIKYWIVDKIEQDGSYKVYFDLSDS